jgi:hypothetical protein
MESLIPHPHNKEVITMNRLEKIKERYVKYESNPNVYDWVNGEHYVEDVSCLIQRLERYDTALKRIETTTELVQAHFLANDALKDS